MKKKTIKAIIRKKVDNWLASIDQMDVRAIAADNAIVTGGCIASMLLNEKINDFDIYFKTKEAAVAVAQYYVDRFNPKEKNGIIPTITVDDSKEDRVQVVVKSAGIASEDGTKQDYQYFESRPDDEAGAYVSEIMDDPVEIADLQDTLDEMPKGDDPNKPPYRPVFVSTNAITLSHHVQLVLRFFGNPEEIHSNYDFVHCTNYWTSWNSDLVLKQEALECLLAKELKYVGSKYPVCSMIRIRKFISRGWTINAGQMLKIAMQISDLDLHDINVLREQLIGVDVAYFLQVIDALKERHPEKVETAYLVEIIDRMF